MAKKRKLRPSNPEPEPEPAKTIDQDQDLLDQQPQQQAEPEQTLDQQQNMAVDEPAPPQDEPQNDVVETAVEEQQGEEDAEAGKEEEEQQEQEQEEEEEEEEETLENQGNQLPEQDQQAAAADSSTQANGAEQEEEEDLGLEDEPVEKLLEPFTREQMYTLVKQAVDKYPEFAENVRQLAEVDPAHRKIFVHGLGWDATAETLTSVFGKYGEIEDCKAVTDKLSGKSKGYAFILFKNRAGARRALKQPQKRIGNRTTSCQLASSGPVPAPPPIAAAPPQVSEYTQRKIFVSNVSSEIDPQRLLEFFRQFGEVDDGPLGLDKNTGKPKGFALFVYKSVESAKKALEEPHKNFEGHTLYCQKAVDGPKGSKGYHQQQHYQHNQHHQHHSHHRHQGNFHHRKDKGAYSSGGPPHGGGHLMAPSAATPPSVGGYVPPAQGLNPALGQALTALFAQQPGLGLGNLLGGIGGAPVNQPGPPAGYGNQPAMNYVNQPGMQPGYQNPQMGQSSGVRPHPGAGAPYMGH